MVARASSERGWARHNTSMITSGFLHSCALTTGGAVKCWGSNSDGQLGDGTTFPRSVPVDAVELVEHCGGDRGR